MLSLENLLAAVGPAFGRFLLPQDARHKATAGEPAPEALGVSFLDIGKEAGLNAKTIFGGEHKNKYLLETTGCGVAFYDYDNDGWMDIYRVNGPRHEGLPAGT